MSRTLLPELDLSGNIRNCLNDDHIMCEYHVSEVINNDSGNKQCSNDGQERNSNGVDYSALDYHGNRLMSEQSSSLDTVSGNTDNFPQNSDEQCHKEDSIPSECHNVEPDVCLETHIFSEELKVPDTSQYNNPGPVISIIDAVPVVFSDEINTDQPIPVSNSDNLIPALNTHNSIPATSKYQENTATAENLSSTDKENTSSLVPDTDNQDSDAPVVIPKSYPVPASVSSRVSPPELPVRQSLTGAIRASAEASGFESRVLCLHYFSNSLSFEFGDPEEVYRMDQIQEWAQIDPLWVDGLKEKLHRIKGRVDEINLYLYSVHRSFYKNSYLNRSAR